MSAVMAAGHNGDIHYHGPYLTVEGDLKARNTPEVEDALMRVSRFGAGAAGELEPA